MGKDAVVESLLLINLPQLLLEGNGRKAREEGDGEEKNEVREERKEAFCIILRRLYYCSTIVCPPCVNFALLPYFHCILWVGAKRALGHTHIRK